MTADPPIIQSGYDIGLPSQVFIFADEHDRRVSELLAANNREVERRRLAEQAERRWRTAFNAVVSLAVPHLRVFYPEIAAAVLAIAAQVRQDNGIPSGVVADDSGVGGAEGQGPVEVSSTKPEANARPSCGGGPAALAVEVPTAEATRPQAGENPANRMEGG